MMTHADSARSHDQVFLAGNTLGYKLQRKWYTWIVVASKVGREKSLYFSTACGRINKRKWGILVHTKDYLALKRWDIWTVGNG
jgi:hypothetical protein